MKFGLAVPRWLSDRNTEGMRLLDNGAAAGLTTRARVDERGLRTRQFVCGLPALGASVFVRVFLPR
ncbi:MAG: hypothetical protein R6V12_18620 [Candidatus Hydrogenedentota bacterium]